MSTLAALTNAATDRALARQVRRALLAKERRELRPALWAGLTIFVALPVFWSVILILLDSSHHSLPGLATLMALLGGWIFAGIVAAQTVCRDFGRAPGVFLAGLPVTRAQIIEAKVTASFGLIVLLGILVAAIDLIQLPIGQRLPAEIDPLRVAFPAAVLPLIVWLLSFLAAAITRNTLTAVVIAIVCLALLAAIPMVSSWTSEFLATLLPSDALLRRLAFWAFASRMDIPSWWSARDLTGSVVTVIAAAAVLLIGLARFMVNRFRKPAERRSWSLGQSLLLVLIFLFLVNADGAPLAFVFLFLVLFFAPLFGDVLARLALRSERGLKISNRAMVTGVSLLILGIFLLAMGEVGASGRIAYTVWGGVAPSIAAGTRCVVQSGASHFEVFNQYSEYRISLVQHGMYPPADPHVNSLVVVNEEDECFALRLTPGGLALPANRSRDGTLAPRASTQCTLENAQLELLQIDPLTGKLSAPRSLVVPRSSESALPYRSFDAAIRGKQLIVLFFIQPVMQSREIIYPEAVLAHYALADSSVPLKPIAVWTPAVADTWPVNGRDFFRSPHWYFARGCDNGTYLVSPYSAPIDLLAPNYNSRRDSRFSPSADDAWGGYEYFPVSASVCAVSTKMGLSLIQEGQPGDGRGWPPREPSKVLGQVRASPWALLFRSTFPNLLAGRKNQLWEIHDKSAICYDVSDATRPRRIMHVQTYPIVNAISGHDFLLLSHNAGFSIVNHPPATR